MKKIFYKIFPHRHNKNKTRSLLSGFTLVEALVAIMILSVSVVTLVGLTASSVVSARYANNQISATYLLQEAIDSIRNSRDTIAFQQATTGGGWANFLARYNKCITGACYLKMENFNPADQTGADVFSCGGVEYCPFLNYDNSTSPQTFYVYTNGANITASKFKRQVVITNLNADMVQVTATVTWLNGTILKTQSLETILTNWQK